MPQISGMVDILKKAIDRKEPIGILKKAVEDASIQSRLYTGKDLDKILFDYRKRESIPQKEQRKRITIGRTKHIIRQIENMIDQLDIMDKPSINVVTQEKDEAKREELLNYIYNNNIQDLAFQYTKYYNLTDSNAFLICRMDKETVTFDVVESYHLYDLKILNNNYEYVIFRFKRKVGQQEVFDYEMYHNEGLLIFTNKTGTQRDENTLMVGDYVVTEYAYSKMMCFPLGYNRDAETRFKTYVTLLDPASELFKALIWQGSDMDTEIATHGILQKYAYAQKCNWQFVNEDTGDNLHCEGGYILKNGTSTNSKCSTCAGTGLIQHTSSQDIVTFPLPNEGEEKMKLSDMSHTVFMPENIFEFKKKYVKEIEQEIKSTVFNNAVKLNQSEIQVTATEKVIDLQGLYATLNRFGMKVSECFIWMMEAYCEMKGIAGCEFLHGYTLNMKLETVESLSESRKRLIDAGSPNEVIKAYDLAILRKQHMDSPQFINRTIIWDSFKPFTDKSENIAITILSGLPNTNRTKILYNYFGQIRKNIERVQGEKFYNLKYDAQKALIDAEIELIRQELISEQPQRIDPSEFDI